MVGGNKRYSCRTSTEKDWAKTSVLKKSEKIFVLSWNYICI